MRSNDRKNRWGRRGNTMLEFAIVATTLVLLLSGGITMGLSLNRAIQVGQVCRNANVLMVRGVDMSQSVNQQLIVRTAAGLGLNVSGTYTPNPSGTAVIFLTKVIRVGTFQCNLGISGWDQNPSTCPNYGQYVIAQRIVIGNGTRWSSSTGSPGSTLLTTGAVTDSDIATRTDDRASGFPGIITLSLDEFTFIAEMFVDNTTLAIFPNMTPPLIAMRNLS